MNYRKQGKRRHRLTASKHDGTLDDHGQPTYAVPGDWDTVVENWPCEVVVTTGNEKIRGRQTTAETTHVFFGEYHGGKQITPLMKAEVSDKTYYVIAAFDADGESREYRVEAKREL